MLGTIVNTTTILIGGTFGALVGTGIGEKLKKVFALCMALFLTGLPALASRIDEIVRQSRIAASEFKYAEAIDQAYLLIDLYNAGESDTLLAKGLKEGGVYCSYDHRYIESLDFFTLAIKVADDNNDEKTHGECLADIGTIYAVFKDYEHAVFYLEQALDLALRTHDEYLLGVATTNLAAAHCKAGNPDRARECLRLEMEYPISNLLVHQFRLNYNQGLIALAENNYKGCIYYQNEGLQVLQSHNGSPISFILAYNEIARAYDLMGKADSAISYYTKAIDIAQQIHADEQLVDAYKSMAEIYKEMGLTDSVTAYQSRYTTLNDSIFNLRLFNNKQKQIYSYEHQRNSEYIHRLNSSISWLITGIAVVLIILLLIVYYTRRLRSAQKLLVLRNEELIQQNLAFNKMLRSPKVEEPEADVVPTVEMGDDEAKNLNLLSESKSNSLLRSINEIMDDQQTIFNPDFNMAMLAKMVNSNTTYVSMVINDTYHKNFKSFLNEYRIREACRRLTDDEHYGNRTISAIAEDVGFNSVNSFFVAFKKITGMTPSVYQKYAKSNE